MPVHAAEGGVHPLPSECNDGIINKLRKAAEWPRRLFQPLTALLRRQPDSPSKVTPTSIACTPVPLKDVIPPDSAVSAACPSGGDDWNELDIYIKTTERYCAMCRQNRPVSEVTLAPVGWTCIDCCALLAECGELDLSEHAASVAKMSS
jgi:hypothetical protein